MKASLGLDIGSVNAKLAAILPYDKIKNQPSYDLVKSPDGLTFLLYYV